MSYENHAPMVSVIIPIYNAESCIEHCVDALKGQTFSDFEIILVNDGSLDESACICQRLEEKDDSIIYVEKENGGAGSARNAGLDRAKGKYIFFCDVDDDIASCLLQKAVCAAEDNKADLVVFPIERRIIDSESGKLIDAHDTPGYSKVLEKAEFRKQFSKLYYEGFLFGGPYNKLFLHEFITQNSIRFPDLRRGQDEIFNFLYYPYVTKCVFLPDVLYIYNAYDTIKRNQKYRLSYFEQTIITYIQTIRDLLNEFELQDDYTIEKFQNSCVFFLQMATELAWNPLENLDRKQKIAFIDSVLHHPFIREIVPTIRFVPDSCKDYWELFRRDDATALYRYITRQKRIRKAKDMIKTFIGRK